MKKSGKVRFAYKPNDTTKVVCLAGSFNNWKQVRIRKQKNGEYVSNVKVPTGIHEYKFVVDDTWQVDTDNELQVSNSFGEMNSVVIVSWVILQVILPPIGLENPRFLSIQIVTHLLKEKKLLSKQEIRHRAVKMGITTGNMPSVDLIWNIQNIDNHAECFGKGEGCPNQDCQWRSKCLALDLYSQTSLVFEEAPQKHSAWVE
jgi:hypothetical protein